ncbi:MAG: hypothetical protein IJY35_02105 [Clostridia bacterium]|nr:hypothetical protein [Clostridia bacterium]
MKSIWAKGLYTPKNITLTFQHRLTPDENTVLTLAASNLYRLFVGGKLVGYGPARAAHGYSRVDCYSLADRAGLDTVISVEVHSANINTFYTVEERPFFACEIRSGDRILADTCDFAAYHMTEKVQRVRRFSYQRAFTESYRLDSDPAVFHAGELARTPVETEEVPMNALLPRLVGYPTLACEYGNVIETGSLGRNPDAVPWHDRAYYNIDEKNLKGFRPDELEEDAGAEASQLTFARGDAGAADFYRIYDFGRTLTGFFTLTVTAHTDCAVYILFDEVKNDRGTYTEVNPYRNDCCNVIKYALKPGTYRLLSFEANAAKYAVCAVCGSAEIDGFGMVKYENPDLADFVYDCGDDELNRIVKAAADTFAQNAVDVLTDCPSRERAGWLCDSYFSSRSERFFTGDNRVEKSFLENYAMAPQSPGLPEGMIPMCYPADHFNGEYIPNWSMWYILELRDYLRRTGDVELIEKSRAKVMGLVKFFERFYNADGLLENLENWVFIEWSRCNDRDFICGVNYPSNMLWSAALDAAAELYGDKSLADKAAAMRETIRMQSYNGEFFTDNAVRNEAGDLVRTDHTSETCQYYAFYFGIASAETHPALLETMMKDFGPHRNPAEVYPNVPQSNAFIGNYLRLELMLRLGMYDEVLADCRGFFSGMAALTGTLWEHARVTCSLNHGFASLAAYYIDCALKGRA